MNDFYDPEFYALKIGLASRVNALYLKAASEFGGPVLELGCGIGDVLLPIAREGITVIGLDRSHSMLDAFRGYVEKEEAAVQMRVHLFEAPMEKLSTLSLPQEVRQIFIPNDGIAHLLDLDTLRMVLNACFNKIMPSGRIILDVNPFDAEYLGRYCGTANELQRFVGRHLLSDKCELMVWERTSYENRTGILSAEFRYEFLDKSGSESRVMYRTLKLHPRRIDEVILALLDSGFDKPEVEEFSKTDSNGPEKSGLIIRAGRSGE